MSDIDTHTVAIQNHYDWSNTAPSLAIVDAIATVESSAATELSTVLGTTLHEHIDPEALDALVTDAEETTISFTVDAYQVRIDGDELTIFNS